MPPAVPHTKTANGSWAATFPSEQETLTDSALFMKRLLYITFSQIISQRRLLTSNCFKKRRCENLRLYVFNAIVPEAYEVADQLRAVCETIEKGYLRELHLNIMDGSGKEDELIEVYKMGVSYGDDKAPPKITLSSNEMGRVDIDYKGKEVLKEQTRELLIRIHQITSKLADLPENVQWTFYILYDDDKTPKGYQARGFNRRPEPYTVAPNAHTLVIGDSSANHHAAHFEVSSVFIEDPVEFEELISGDLAAMQSFMRDSRDSSIDDATTPTKKSNVNDTFEDVPAPAVEVKEPKKRAKAGAGLVADLEKAAQNMQIGGKDDRLSSSSPEERQSAKKEQSPSKKVRQPKDKSASPSKILKASKTIKKTPGNVGVRGSKKRER